MNCVRFLLFKRPRGDQSELLQPVGAKAKKRFQSPVEMSGSALGTLDPNNIKSIQAGATGTASGIALTCTKYRCRDARV